MQVCSNVQSCPSSYSEWAWHGPFTKKINVLFLHTASIRAHMYHVKKGGPSVIQVCPHVRFRKSWGSFCGFFGAHVTLGLCYIVALFWGYVGLVQGFF